MVWYFMSLKVTLLGDKDYATTLRVPAKNQLDILRQQMAKQGLLQGQRRLKFDDGTTFTCKSVFGIDSIEIYTPLLEDLKKKYNVFVAITIKSPFYVEIEDPDFTDYQHQNGHKFYWILPRFSERYGQYVTEMVISDPGTPRSVINRAVSEALYSSGVKIQTIGGVDFGVAPFDFATIQKMFPTSLYWPDGDAYNGRGQFREAKSFSTGDLDYTAYSTGALRYRGEIGTENIFDELPDYQSKKRKYHQFHIIGDYRVWFGMEHKHEVGYPDWVNLNVKVCKVISGAVNELYSFTVFDYLGILGWSGTDLMFCDGPAPGNVLSYLRPPAYFDTIKSVSDSEITIIAKSEHALGSICGAHDYEDYGCGSGSHIEMTFDSSGTQTAGNRNFDFQVYIAGADDSDTTGPTISSTLPTPTVADTTTSAYSFTQKTKLDFGNKHITNTRGVKNIYTATPITRADGSVVIAKDRGYLLEADAKITPRWSPRMLGSNGFSLNSLTQSAHRDVIREYDPVLGYGAHSGLADRYCSESWQIWNDCW